MLELTTLRSESRYGMPAADQILFNRHYITGYSYYFRQPKWTLEIVDPIIADDDPLVDVDREDNFRPDYRVPQVFRADLVDFRGSGYDRGHMVASANQRDIKVQNSETFLLSNMSPQVGELNRRKWKDLEIAIRQLNAKKTILETYVVTGPIFNFDEAVKTIGEGDKNQVTIPVPHAYFKSVLTENSRGTLYMWSFILPNMQLNEPLEAYRVPTTTVEQYAGILLWDKLVGTQIEREKKRVRKMW